MYFRDVTVSKYSMILAQITKTFSCSTHCSKLQYLQQYVQVEAILELFTNLRGPWELTLIQSQSFINVTTEFQIDVQIEVMHQACQLCSTDDMIPPTFVKKLFAPLLQRESCQFWQDIELGLFIQSPCIHINNKKYTQYTIHSK